MELLSTVHWILNEDRNLINEPEEVIKRVQKWNPRKGRIFFRKTILLKTVQHFEKYKVIR
ncbi:hypothetical protein GCM10020331_093000 [Ectobacillus funiculus]